MTSPHVVLKDDELKSAMVRARLFEIKQKIIATSFKIVGNSPRGSHRSYSVHEDEVEEGFHYESETDSHLSTTLRNTDFETDRHQGSLAPIMQTSPVGGDEDTRVSGLPSTHAISLNSVFFTISSAFFNFFSLPCMTGGTWRERHMTR